METQPTQGLTQPSRGTGQTTKGSLMSLGTGGSAPDDLLASGFSDILAGLQLGGAANDLANALPLAGQGLPHHDLKRDAGLSEELETDLGFHAQSLVSSLLTTPNNPVEKLRKELSNPLNAAGLQSESGMGLDSPLDAEVRRLNDRFLGSQNSMDKLGLSLAKPDTFTDDLPAPVSAQAVSSPLAALQAETALVAANANEDPITQSLQDLKYLDEGEKAELENKLSTSERKQDEQTLKLTKSQQAWGDALSERISMNAAKNIKQVTIHLDPPELGTLELKLQVKEDQQTQVMVQVQNPQVKEALESSAQRLRDMLAAQGMELAELDVHTSPDQGRGGDGHGGQSNAEESFAQEGRQGSDDLGLEGEEIVVDISLPKNNNLLDTFA
jgi:flagellar hook-length control protein FliK